MTKTVPDLSFGQAQITFSGVKLVFQGPNHPPTCLVKEGILYTLWSVYPLLIQPSYLNDLEKYCIRFSLYCGISLASSLPKQ